MFHDFEGVHAVIDNPFAEEPKPQGPAPARWVDATVTGVSPLMIRLDGYDEDPQPPTKPPLVGGLAVNQRVLCQLQGRQLIILGRYGG